MACNCGKGREGKLRSDNPRLYLAKGQLPPEQAPVEQGLGAAGAAAGAGLPLP